MKTAIASAALALVFAVPGMAASDHGGHVTVQAPAAAGAHMSDGLVRKVDRSSGKVTVAHGPLPNLGMQAMTMVFRVKDAAWLGQMKEGDKIRFIADRIGGAYTIVHLEMAK